MSRTGITYDEVTAAALAIQGNGERPTIDKVRAYLGGTGSNTTISKYLEAWRNEIVHLNFKSEKAEAAPDLVKAAVERVWQEMREQTDATIETIKTETETLVAAAEKRMELSEGELKRVQGEHHTVLQSFQGQSAEKELLLLDVKRLKEEESCLQERYLALEQRYTDMQGLTAHHLADLTRVHQEEIARLSAQNQEQEEKYTKFIKEMREQYENERHAHMVVMDELKIENQKQKKHSEKCELLIQEKSTHITRLEENLKSMDRERENLLAHLDAQRIVNQDKSSVADHLLTNVVDVSTFNAVFEKWNDQFMELTNQKLNYFNEVVETIKLNQMDLQDE